MLSAAEGGKEASSPETASRTALRPPVLHETILDHQGLLDRAQTKPHAAILSPKGEPQGAGS